MKRDVRGRMVRVVDLESLPLTAVGSNPTRNFVFFFLRKLSS